MTIPVWNRTIVNDMGDIQPGSEVEVIIESTGLPATLYSNRAGTTALTNPFFADGNGFAQFYAAPDEYRITATATSGSVVWRYEQLGGTAATHDVTTGPTDVTTESLLRVDDAYAVNSLNYHRANTNFNVFGADAVGDLILLGEARTAVQARLYGNTSSPTAPISITVSGTFSLVTPSGTTLKTGIASSDMILSSDSTGKLFNIAVLNLVGATVKDTYELRAELSTSKITVNF